MKPSLVCSISLLLFLLSVFSSVAVSYDPLDPTGNITIRWDVMQWTTDGYVALVNISNYQKYRPVTEPGWQLSWTWDRQEVLWNAFGAKAIHRGDCSRFKGNIPQSCDRRPAIIDLNAAAPYNQQVYGCCRSGVLAAEGVRDPTESTAAFQLTVGAAGTTNRTVRLPKNFTLDVLPRGGYVCGVAKLVRPTRFVTPDGRRVTQALMTWQVVCTYSPLLASKVPSCCVSWSSLDHQLSARCKDYACNCSKTSMGSTMKGGMKCTNHRCPINIDWHLTSRGRDNWAARVLIDNYNKMNYSDWTILLQLQPQNQLVQVHHANHKHLSPSSRVEMFWGIKNYNEVLTKNVSWDVYYKKEGSNNETQGDSFYTPQAVYFNGDPCSLPL